MNLQFYNKNKITQLKTIDKGLNLTTQLIHSKWMEDLHKTAKTLKLLENIRQSLDWFGIWWWFCLIWHQNRSQQKKMLINWFHQPLNLLCIREHYCQSTKATHRMGEISTNHYRTRINTQNMQITPMTHQQQKQPNCEMKKRFEQTLPQKSYRDGQ